VAPPGQTATFAPGSSLSAELHRQRNRHIADAQALLGAAEVYMSPSKVSRLVKEYEREWAPKGRYTFAEFFINRAELSVQQRRRPPTDPDHARAITYADPTGETAIRNVREAIRGGGG
jgi:hypothetical protein